MSRDLHSRGPPSELMDSSVLQDRRPCRRVYADGVRTWWNGWSVGGVAVGTDSWTEGEVTRA